MDLLLAAQRTWKAFLKFGPVNDGRPEGDAFTVALENLLVATKHTQKKIDKLEEALNEASELLCDIRYREWPVIGLGIGMTAERMDEVIQKLPTISIKFKGKTNKSEEAENNQFKKINTMLKKIKNQKV